MSRPDERQEHLLQLLCDLAAGEPGALEHEGEALRLLEEQADLDAASFERAAAAIHLACLLPMRDELPASLRDRLAGAAAVFEQAEDVTAPLHPPAPAHPAGGAAYPRAPLVVGWLLAAAAGLALVVQTARSGAPAGPRALTPAEVAAAGDALRLPWTATEDPDARGVTGDVVWSNELQQGFMRFEGLPRNDPAVGQYQLWIFDASRPEATPVDGGVFDVAGGPAVVPIDAKLDVVRPTLFAVTFEPPGGVVVSSRERLLLVAQP